MRIINRLLPALFIFLICSCSTNEKKAPELRGRDVVRMINNYDVDSLRNVMAHAFIMDFDYISFQGTKDNFLNETMVNAKAVNARYEILDVKNESEGKFQYIIKDKSAFETFFRIEPPKMMLTIVINDSSKLEKIYVDSLPGYHQYNSQFTQRMNEFGVWHSQKYADETMEQLMEDQTGKIEERLKEFSKTLPSSN